MKKLIITLALLALATACTKSEETTNPAEPAEPAGADQPAPGEAAKPGEAAQPAAAAPAADSGKGLGPALDFTLKDLDGKEVSLSQHKGKTVVLEWFNPGCPFVKYAHGEGPLTDMAAKKAEQGIVWLAINSGASGKQGHGVDTNKQAAQQWSMSYPVLLDESGEVGKAYGAKTTPHMYVIDGEGNLVYRGALDNAPLGEARGDSHINYVENALAAVAAGKPVEPAETKAYGCSVKYAD